MSLTWICHCLTPCHISLDFPRCWLNGHALVGQKVQNTHQQPKIFETTVRRYSHALQALQDHKATSDPRLTNFNRRFLAEWMAHIARSAPNTKRPQKIMCIAWILMCRPRATRLAVSYPTIKVLFTVHERRWCNTQNRDRQIRPPAFKLLPGFNRKHNS